MACLRNRDRPPSKQFPEVLALGDAAFDFKFEDSELLEEMIAGDTREKFPEKYTQHCWLVECRGCVGETVFHVCFLMGTPVHMHLAKRLLKHFPLLLNDVYLSEEYYGENVLHMAAVAEDPSIVKVNIKRPTGAVFDWFSGSWISGQISTDVVMETSLPATIRRALEGTTKTTKSRICAS